MCTVSFIPKVNGDFILTSNRDESPNRSTIPPGIYELNDTRLLFPKDEIAGGTWIGASDKKRLICLLNGGFEAHIPKDAYRLSRGIIVKNLLTVKDAVVEIDLINLNDIEPFTIILVEYLKELKLYELVWDGKNKYFSEKELNPIIWSSSLLYSKEIKFKREKWFSEFMKNDNNPNKNDVLSFHKNAGESDEKSNIVMNRGFVCTKSITLFQKKNYNEMMRYEDLQTGMINKMTL
tara:strand:- start:15747 stop:16451 length:705 start_codon:yes stop_codon:yes gene_type:complete